jgi:GDP-mannose transporter
MAGALNKLPIALSGLIFFDAPTTFGSVSAIGVGFVSGLVYCYAKIKQGKDKDKGLPMTRGGPIVSASSQSSKEAFKG